MTAGSLIVRAPLRVEIDMDLQQAFNHVCRTLAWQGRRSIDAGGCRYRTELDNGGYLYCAVGAFIPNEAYVGTEFRIENKSIEELFNANVLTSPKIREELKSENRIFMFFHRLQLVHDGASSLISLKAGLTNIAELYHLDSADVSLITRWRV